MGTYWDDEGLHWRPMWFPWVERARGWRWFGNVLCDGTWYRLAPKILEESEALNGMVMQTVQFSDGREQVREAPWRRQSHEQTRKG